MIAFRLHGGVWSHEGWSQHQVGSTRYVQVQWTEDVPVFPNQWSVEIVDAAVSIVAQRLEKACIADAHEAVTAFDSERVDVEVCHYGRRCKTFM